MSYQPAPASRASDPPTPSSAPVAIWEADVSALQVWFDSLRAAGTTDLRPLLKSDPHQVLYGLHLVKVHQVNEESVRLFEADNQQHLLENAPLVMATVPLAALTEMLMARWENRLSLCLETRMATLQGNQIYGLVGISVPIEGDTPDLSRIIVTFADITDRKRSEEALRESIERLQLVMTASGTGWWDWNLRANVLTVDDRCKALLGVAPDTEVTFELLRQRLRPEDRSRIDQGLQGVLAQPGDFEVECAAMWPDGSVHWALLRGRSFHTPMGVPLRLMGVAADITARKQAEEARRESEEFYRTLIETLPVTVVLADHQGYIRYVSPAAKEMFGLEPGEGTGTIPTDWIAPEHREVALHRMRLVLVEQQPQPPLEYRLLKRDGSSVWAQIASAPILDAQGRLKSIIMVCQDVTQRKRVEDELNKLNETLEQQVAERTAIAERRSTQLRILASELAQAEQRERRRLAKILHDHLQQLLYAAKLKTGLLRRSLHDEASLPLLQQTADLLDESIAESRSLAMALSPPVLYDRGLVGAIQWLAREFNQKHNLSVELELEAEAEPNDEGTRVFVFEAIRELLLNVVKHAQTPSAHVRLASLGQEQLQAVVSDTGMGFDASRLESRGPNTGFGLLSIRERLEVMGGRLEIDSATGKGTRVILEVPRGPAVTSAERAREAVAVASSMALDTGQTSVPAPSAFNIVRVLVADDHRVVREGLITVLHDQPDIEVVGEAADGQQAFELALCMKPDVVLMDVTMPGVDGIEATRRITRAMPEVRVIGLSMHKRDDMAAAMREAGAANYLSKEVAADELVAAVLATASSHE